MSEHRLQASVGRGGVNHHHDVHTAQTLLNACLPTPLEALRVDGVCGQATIGAIDAVQRKLMEWVVPDGRIDPVGPTLSFLQRHMGRHSHRNRLPAGGTPAPHPRPAPSMRLASSTAPAPAAPSQPAGQSTAGQPGAGVPSDVASAAQAANQKWRIPASVTIAQWMVESGYGRHMPSGSNNPFGIKAAGGQPYVEARTREVVHGQSVMMVQRFRKFDSLAEAFDEHGRLLATARPYAPARQKLPDPFGFSDALTGVYATDPNYGTMLKRQIQSHGLTRYD